MLADVHINGTALSPKCATLLSGESEDIWVDLIMQGIMTYGEFKLIESKTPHVPRQ